MAGALGDTAGNLRGARNLAAFAFVMVWGGVMTFVASRLKRRTQTSRRGALRCLVGFSVVRHRANALYWSHSELDDQSLPELACREAGKLRRSINMQSVSAPGHLNESK